MTRTTFLALALSTVSLIGIHSASAAQHTIKSLPDQGNVTISGTVDKVENEREFTLRDQTGTIEVNIKNNKSIVLKQGDKVTVTGAIDTGLFTGKDINATSVEVNKNLASSVSDAVTSATGITMDDAEAVTVQQLPEEGMVKLTGQVADVKNEKEFTLRDSTGSVNVNVQSDQNTMLSEGARVTVVGYVDSGLIGKDIRATRVVVTDSAPSAGQTNY